MTKEDKFYEAVRMGVADGIERLALRGSDAPGGDFFAAIQCGVREAVSKMDFEEVVAEQVSAQRAKAEELERQRHD